VGVEFTGRVFLPDILEAAPARARVAPAGEPSGAREACTRAVTDLYREHAVGLIRLAVVMLGDRPTAEDVVQEAFCGLYRRWSHLSDPAKSLIYVRSSVLNGCRTAMRKRARRLEAVLAEPAAASAEADAIIGEEHRAVVAALRRLPPRQREALVLKFFGELEEPEIARAMSISRGTVKSTISRGLAALGDILGESW
jgi:RNA polymerase sigma-70 factor (sigma-E family)